MSKITKEVRIGIAFIVALFLLYFGINFLKGVNIFKPANAYVVVFSDVAGLLKSDAVTINGLKVGQIFSMELDPDNPKSVLVHLHLDKGVQVPVGSSVHLDAGMISGSTLILEPKMGVTEYYTSTDRIKGEKKSGLMDAAATVVPKIENLLPKLDSILLGINKLVNNQALTQTLDNVSGITEELSHSSKQLTTLLTALNRDLPKISQNLVVTTDNFQHLSHQVKGIDIVSTFNKLDSTMTNVQHLSGKLTSRDNSVGLLLNDTQIYDELNKAVENASLLLEDVKANPSRYINVKVF